MEVEDEDSILERLFFKKYGRALPEKEKESDVDKINFVIDLTDDADEMGSDPTPALIPVVKTEPIETPESVPDVTNVNVADASKRRSFRLERLELAKARKAITEFGKSLRKDVVIPEKEAPENVIADTDSNMSEANSVNPVGSVNVVESLTTAEAIEMAEAAIAEIAATQKVIDEFED
jgi:hypothetical protein